MKKNSPEKIPRKATKPRNRQKVEYKIQSFRILEREADQKKKSKKEVVREEARRRRRPTEKVINDENVDGESARRRLIFTLKKILLPKQNSKLSL